MSAHPLRKYRDQNNLSQAELAEKLGISRQLVGFIESGERPVTPENAKEWGAVLGIPLHELCPDIFDPPVSAKSREARPA